MAKMAAEMVLCENLFSGFVLLVLINRSHPLCVLSLCGSTCQTLILILLAICSAHRIIAFVGRENRLIRLHFGPSTGKPRVEAVAQAPP